MSDADARWMLRAWDELSTSELYALMVLRQRVFVVEQRCPYLDADGYDPKAWHLYRWRSDGSIDAAARLFLAKSCGAGHSLAP